MPCANYRDGGNGLRPSIINIGNYLAVNPHLLRAINIRISRRRVLLRGLFRSTALFADGANANSGKRSTGICRREFSQPLGVIAS